MPHLTLAMVSEGIALIGRVCLEGPTARYCCSNWLTNAVKVMHSPKAPEQGSSGPFPKDIRRLSGRCCSMEQMWLNQAQLGRSKSCRVTACWPLLFLEGAGTRHWNCSGMVHGRRRRRQHVSSYWHGQAHGNLWRRRFERVECTALTRSLLLLCIHTATKASTNQTTPRRTQSIGRLEPHWQVSRSRRMMVTAMVTVVTLLLVGPASDAAAQHARRRLPGAVPESNW
mmetsp:Transcript_49953/g.99160  ORF Transcript_49953/g.99160 Transcript_49953/m.99160 type:complete len:227 (-) Transcript_49953:9-689(-)